MGAILIDAGRPDEALAVLDKATAILDFDPDAWNYKGAALAAKGESEKALAAYGKALEIDGNSAIVDDLGALHLGLFEGRQFRTRSARHTAAFRRSVELDPDAPPPQSARAASR